MFFGAQYYPEQWPEERWPVDVQMMAEAGVNTVRMGEFAWSGYEPREGEYDFGWMDRVLELLSEKGIGVIMCTCSRTPPPWVYKRYPGIENVNIDGRRGRAGARYAYCPSNSDFREAALRIDRMVIDHFAGHPAIAGWQIDNEVGGSNDCFCETCLETFQEYLREKYGSVDELNRSWGPHFWSFAFGSFDEVPMVHPVRPNPQLNLEYRRFLSHQNIRFLRDRTEYIRKKDPGKWITTNFQSGKTRHTDYHEMSKYIDYNGMNYYPARSPELVVDYYRGNRGRVLVLEQFTRLAPVDSGPGWMRLWAWQAVARGAKGINFFRWRVSRQGQEMHRDGMLPQAGQPNRRYEELKRMGAEVKNVGDILDGVQPRGDVAICYSYDSRWALDDMPVDGIDAVDEAVAFHDALTGINVAVDAMDTRADISGSKLVIAPRAFLLDDATVENLTGFAESGGVLCLTAGTGVVDRFGRCFDVPRPGPLREAAGIEVSDLSSLDAGVAVRGVAQGLEEYAGAGRYLADEIHLIGAQAAAEYASGWRDGHPAITVHRYGEGRVVYIGTALTEDSVAALIPWLCRLSGVAPILETVEGVHALRQVGDGVEVLFLLNYNGSEYTQELDDEWEDIFCGGRKCSRVTIAPVDLAILRRTL